MKILRLLNKKLLSVILFSFFFISVAAEEKPVDIWNIEKKQIDNDLNGNETSNIKEDEIKLDSKSEIYQMQSKKKIAR